MGSRGVLMALLRRQTTGKGDYIDISMHEALMASCANVVGTAFTEGRQPDVKQQRTTGGSAFYRDLRHVRRPPARAGRPGDEVHPEPAGGARPARPRAALRVAGRASAAGDGFPAATFRKRSLAEWMDCLAGLDICYGPVNTLPEAIADPNLRAAPWCHGRSWTPPHCAGDALQGRAVAADFREPLLGEHTAEILAGTGAEQAARRVVRG